MPAIVYARVSTDRQACEGVSLDAQESACRAHAARLGLDVVAAHRDAGFSGRLGHEDRPGLAAVIEACRADPATVVVVYSLSRLGRSQRRVAELLDERGAYRLRLVSVTEPIDMSTAMGRAIAGVITAFAQLESDLASERVTMAMAHARSRGVKFGRPATPAALVARVREVAASMPGASAGEIATELNGRGIATARHGRWHAATVARVLAAAVAAVAAE